jgi:2-polyprenyl-6-methoxyphenol hydroxylase-like FAD-dependent oxidoreductase
MTAVAGGHGVVLGGGFTGMLAASVLADRLSSVTILDRDELPDEPRNRKGVPQAHHGHLLVARGARLLDDLLPGVIADVVAAGGRRLRMPTDMVTLTPQGWMPRLPEMQFGISASRALLDWVIRDRVLRNDRISVHTATEVEALAGTADRITGVRTRNRRTGEAGTLSADVVIDATGRGSQSPRWLGDLGLPQVASEVVDAGLAYATRRYRAPDSAGSEFPLVAVQPDVVAGQPSQAAMLFPIEHNHWLITLAGTRGGEPPTDEDAFAAFAGRMRHGIIGELIEVATPVDRVRGYRNTANRWYRYDRLRAWPAGFFVVGDALAVTNPTYALGLTTAAAAVAELAAVFDRPHLAGDPLAAQRPIARTIRAAWQMATFSDAPYAGTTPGASVGLLRRSVNARLLRAAVGDPVVLAALLDAYTLSGSVAALAHPRIFLRLLRGSTRSATIEPPFTPQEFAVSSRISMS